jgi:glycosyltransferase involved in cell wall biosynthesis
VHILVSEVALSGHHANYLEHIAALFLSQGHRVTVSVLDKHLTDPLFDRLQAAYPDRLVVAALPPQSFWLSAVARLGVAGTELRHWLMFKLFFQRLHATDKVDQVFFPYLDYCLHATALLGSPCGRVSWSGICMRPSFHYNGAGVIAPKPKWRSIKERLFYRLLRQPSLHQLLTIDELLEQQTRRKRSLNAQKLMFVPDPTELTNHFDRVSARNQLGISEQDFVILVYGAIDGRKGVEHLLAGVRNKQFMKNLKILVMGRHTPAIREKLQIEPTVMSIDSYVDAATEEAGFRAADVVWMGYNAHYAMSGVLVLAAFAGKPVIATQNGLIGWMTRQYKLGLAIDCENSHEVAQAIHRFLSTPRSDLSSTGMHAIRMRHSWIEFNRTLLQALPSEQNN